MIAIFRRELRAYFTSMTAYVFIAFVLLFAGIYTMAYNLNAAYPNFEYVLQNMTVIFLFAIPILSMRVIAEERRQKTDQLLYALPIGMTRVVLGKYLAMIVVVGIPCAVMAFYPLMLTAFGEVPLLTAYGTLLAFFLLSSALSAIGLLISSLTDNQAVAAGLCFVVMLLLYFMSDLASFVSDSSSASLLALMVAVLLLSLIIRLMTRSTPAALLFFVVVEALLLGFSVVSPESFEGLFGRVMDGLSVFSRFYTFVGGVFDLSAVLYDASVIGVSLFLAVQSMEKRRWNG